MVFDDIRYLVSSKQFRFKINSACWTLSGPHLHSWSWLVFQTSIPINFLLKNQQHIKIYQNETSQCPNVQGFAKEHWKSTICTGPALWAKISAFQNSNQHSQQSEQCVQQPKIHAFHQVEKRSNSVKLSKVFTPILACYLQVGSWDHGIWDVCNSSLLRTWNLSHRCISLSRVFQTQKSTSLLRMPLCNTGLSRRLTKTANHGNLMQFSNNALAKQCIQNQIWIWISEPNQMHQSAALAMHSATYSDWSLRDPDVLCIVFYQ